MPVSVAVLLFASLVPVAMLLGAAMLGICRASAEADRRNALVRARASEDERRGYPPRGGPTQY
jgi:hypothetical protein